MSVLDVATGGGHVARRLREAGATVVTVDPAPGMQADTTAPAEALPFADGELRRRRLPHRRAPFRRRRSPRSRRWRASQASRRDLRQHFVSESSEEADRVRDPSHVRNYSAAEWHSFFELAGLEVADEAFLERPLEIQPWLDRAGTSTEDQVRVRELLGDRIKDGWMSLPTLVIKGTQK